MNRLLFTITYLTLLSCNNQAVDHPTISVPTEKHIANVDTVTKKKLSPIIDYNKYKVVDTFSGKKASINHSSNLTASRFRSAIKWSLDNFGLNFAGHYNLARWGCGTNCLNGAITDLQTGDVYDIPAASLDYDFRRDSRLLIINPPDSLGYYDTCFYCQPQLWIWNDSKKQFEKLK